MNADAADQSRTTFSRAEPRRPQPWRPIILVSLLVVAVAGVAGWLLAKESSSPIPGFVPAEPRHVADIQAVREKIASIAIQGQGRTVVLRRNGTSWRLASNNGYPVPEQRIDGTLATLQELYATYVSEQSPPPYEAMGLAGLDDPAGPTTKVTIADQGDGDLLSFSIGSSISAPGGRLKPMTAVVLPHDSRIWLVDGSFQLASDPVRWVDNRITNVPPDRLAALTISAPDGARLALQRATEGTGLVVTEGLAPGERIRATWLPRELAGVLTDLTFLDVQPAETFDFSQNTWKAEIATTDGITYHAMLQREDMGAWATLRAEAKSGSVTAAAQSFNARHEGWAYLLNEYAARRLMTRPQDLIQAE